MHSHNNRRSAIKIREVNKENNSSICPDNYCLHCRTCLLSTRLSNYVLLPSHVTDYEQKIAGSFKIDLTCWFKLIRIMNYVSAVGDESKKEGEREKKEGGLSRGTFPSFSSLARPQLPSAWDMLPTEDS